LGGVLLAFSAALFGQTTVTNQGTEFSILGSIPGDQVLPSLALSPTGGVVAWQDNRIDKIGQGVGGALLDPTFTAGREFRVNRTATGDQINPQVALLANNRMIFVWQSSVTGVPCIYARFARNAVAGATGYGTNFFTGDIRVNTYVADQQEEPAVAALPDSSAIITWASYGEDGSMWGVYARRLNQNGGALPVEKGAGTKQFLVNQFTSFNQRSPAVAVLANGNFVITWISEQQRSSTSLDVYARVFGPTGLPVTDEIPVNSATNGCANPAVAPLNDGGFTVVWAEKDPLVLTNGYDIWGRAFSGSGAPETAEMRINTFLYGDQYHPKIAASPAGSLVVWTSLGEDGSREGVYGRFLAGGTQVSGPEFRVNTTTISQQMHPAVAWNGADHFLVVWTSFSGATGFDLFGQAYILNSTP
jgi:hypothetical protein